MCFSACCRDDRRLLLFYLLGRILAFFSLMSSFTLHCLLLWFFLSQAAHRTVSSCSNSSSCTTCNVASGWFLDSSTSLCTQACSQGHWPDPQGGTCSGLFLCLLLIANFFPPLSVSFFLPVSPQIAIPLVSHVFTAPRPAAPPAILLFRAFI